MTGLGGFTRVGKLLECGFISNVKIERDRFEMQRGFSFYVDVMLIQLRYFSNS